MSLTKVPNRMESGSPVSVIDFGADPTGTSDSTSGIQGAIDYAISSGINHVYFPAGEYLFTSITASPSSRGFRLSGQNMKNTKLTCTQANGEFNIARNDKFADYCYIEHLSFDGDALGRRVYIETNYTTCNRCEFVNFTETCCYNLGLVNTFQDCHFLAFTAIPTDANLRIAWNACQIVNCYLNGNEGTMLKFEVDASKTECVQHYVSGCTLETGTVQLNSSEDIVFNGNYSEECNWNINGNCTGFVMENCHAVEESPIISMTNIGGRQQYYKIVDNTVAFKVEITSPNRNDVTDGFIDLATLPNLQIRNNVDRINPIEINSTFICDSISVDSQYSSAFGGGDSGFKRVNIRGLKATTSDGTTEVPIAKFFVSGSSSNVDGLAIKERTYYRRQSSGSQKYLTFIEANAVVEDPGTDGAVGSVVRTEIFARNPRSVSVVYTHDIANHQLTIAGVGEASQNGAFSTDLDIVCGYTDIA